MKIQTILIAAFITLTACSSERDVVAADVPQTVTAAFQAKFPGAEDVEWELEDENGRVIYEADFKHDGKRQEAHFSPDGTIVEED